jgi:hypothetical protein
MNKLETLIVRNRLLWTTEGRKINVFLFHPLFCLITEWAAVNIVLVCLDEKMSAHSARSCVSVRGVIRVRSCTDPCWHHSSRQWSAGVAVVVGRSIGRCCAGSCWGRKARKGCGGYGRKSWVGSLCVYKIYFICDHNTWNKFMWTVKVLMVCC